jgi:hypothetical protein
MDRTMTRDKYHEMRRSRFDLISSVGSSNAISYSPQDAELVRQKVAAIDSAIRPPFDYKENARYWRVAALQNRLRYFVRFGKKQPQRSGSIWP